MANINLRLAAAQPQPINPQEARARWQAFRVANGFAPRGTIMSPQDANLKFDKDHTVYIFGLSLAQSTTSGVANVCPFSTPACRACCVAKNGNGAYNKTQDARALKVKWLVTDPSAFITLMAAEIDAAAAEHGDRLRVRLNTFSDIRWEDIAPWLFTDRPNVQFYDYTKDWNRITPDNYRVTWSVSERHKDIEALARVDQGQNVAVVFTTKKTSELPAVWHGVRVVDGDKTDNRADDPAGVIVGLRAKGRMRTDKRGMVRGAS